MRVFNDGKYISIQCSSLYSDENLDIQLGLQQAEQLLRVLPDVIKQLRKSLVASLQEQKQQIEERLNALQTGV